jgi:hypothetical protein
MKVSTMANFLEGKARRTYMSIMAPTMEEWTLSSINYSLPTFVKYCESDLKGRIKVPLLQRLGLSE